MRLLVWGGCALFIALAPIMVGAMAKAHERAIACAWTHDPDPHWDDGRPMDAEDCRYMGGTGWEDGR